jgi:hypothetical protein
MVIYVKDNGLFVNVRLTVIHKISNIILDMDIYVKDVFKICPLVSSHFHMKLIVCHFNKENYERPFKLYHTPHNQDEHT